MLSKSVIWMNVSTSVSWKRPPVGIVRVERELCRELKQIYGENFKLCIFKEGEFVPYSGDLEYDDFEYTLSEDLIPDSSFDFPQIRFLEPTLSASSARETSNCRDGTAHRSIEFGDTLISVGLDWDWENHRIDKIFYDLKKNRGVNIVTCCYDLIPILFPQYCVGDVASKFKEYFINLTWSTSLMLCISRKTESDYLEFASGVGLPLPPTVVIPLGSNLPDQSGHMSDTVTEIAEDPFILFVSTIERRKNHEILYKAYHLICRTGLMERLPKLVFVGMPGWGVGDLLKDIELDPQVSEHIVQFHQVNDAELRLLYTKCLFFVYPSLYEGWGLPIAEALSFGKMVLASSNGSIPEVGGDLVRYLDPWDPHKWANEIANLCRNPLLVAEQEALIKRSFVPNNWKQTACVIKDAIISLSDHQAITKEMLPGYDLRTMVGVPYAGRILSQKREGVLAFGPYISCPAGYLSADLIFNKLGVCSGTIKIRLSCAQGNVILSEADNEIAEEAIGQFSIRFKNVKIDSMKPDLEVFVAVDAATEISFDRLIFHFNYGDIRGA